MSVGTLHAQEICGNGIDDDFDCNIDCDDEDCGPIPFRLNNGQALSIVVGQWDFNTGTAGVSTGKFDEPYDIAVSKITGKVFASDKDNHRVLRFSNLEDFVSRKNPEIAFGQEDFYSRTYGTSSSKFNDPAGICIDDDDNLWVTDLDNNRILKFENASNVGWGASASIVLGQYDFNSSLPSVSASRLNHPSEVLVDDSGDLWVADQLNHRVLRFSDANNLGTGANADLVLGKSNFTSAVAGTSSNAMGQASGLVIICDDLYVSDASGNRIMKFANYSSLTNGAVCDLVLGQSTFIGVFPAAAIDRLSSPRILSTDKYNNLYVADAGNSRVMVFHEANAKTMGDNADRVIGQSNFTSFIGSVSSTRLKTPTSVVMVETGGASMLIVSDFGNNRFCGFGQAGYSIFETNPLSGVLPGVDVSGEGGFQFSAPIQPEKGTMVITNPSTGAFTFTPIGLCQTDGDEVIAIPYTMTNNAGCTVNAEILVEVLDIGSCNEDCTNGIDDDGDCLVDCDDPECDVSTNPIINGMDADMVVGQPDFMSNASSTTASTFSSPMKIVQDPISGKIFVSDQGNHRVLRYANTEDFASNNEAELAIGQPDLTSSINDVGPTRLSSPTAITIDNDGTLWICDFGNNRILWFNDAANIGLEPIPNGVIGQDDFFQNLGGLAQDKIKSPSDIALDQHGNLWVSDMLNQRVLRFSDPKSESFGKAADLVIGAQDFDSIEFGVDRRSIGHTWGIEIICDMLFVSDSRGKRVMVYQDVHNLYNGADADYVLGQYDFTSSTGGVLANKFETPEMLSKDNDGRLYISDVFSNRVMVYERPLEIHNGKFADYVLGQPNFTGSGAAVGAAGLDYAHGVTEIEVDGEDLLAICDYFNNRIVLHNAQILTTDELTTASDEFDSEDLSGWGGLSYEIFGQPYIGEANLINVVTGAFEYVPSNSCTTDSVYNDYITYQLTNSVGCTRYDRVKIEVANSEDCAEICDNGIDDDFDGQIDVYDNDCDNDEDGVPNGLDQDQDNDGISDYDENDLSLSQCNSYELATLFYDDFGSGTRTYSPNGTLCYEPGLNTECSSDYDNTFSETVNRGEYALVSNTDDANLGHHTWVILDDYDDVLKSRMMVVNPGDQDQLLYSVRLENVMPNSRLYVKISYLNLSPNGAGNPLPKFRILAKTETTNVTTTIFSAAESGTWKTANKYIGTIDDSIVEIQILNAGDSGDSEGFAIDNIRITELVYDCDNDGVANLMDLDSDNDGAPDIIEQTNADTEKDGITDNINPDKTLITDANANGWDDNYEGDTIEDTDGDGVRNVLDLDCDNDGIFDMLEISGPDNDFDGKFGLGALFDSNNNGLVQQIDPDEGGTPLLINDSDSDGIPDFLEMDSDNDGCYDVREAGFPDNDNDGVLLEGVLGLDFNVSNQGVVTP